MRIAYLSSSTIPSDTANSVHVMKMCRALAAQGHEVSLVARRGAGASGDDHARYGVEASFKIVKCATPRPPVGAEALYALAAAARLWRIRPRLVYGRHLLSVCAAAARGLPVVLEAHAPPTRFERSVQRKLFARPGFARLVVISDALRRELERLHPELAADRVLVAHDGADAPAAPTAPPLEPGGRRDAELRVGYVGHLYPGKGMEVVAALAARLPRFDFHVVGGTGDDLRRWREKTRGQANLLFHGFVPPARADAYRAAMDVLLAPYQRTVAVAGGRGDVARWMSPLKVFEYMAAGRAVVASDLPVLREVLTDGGEALLVPPDDLGAWRDALERLRDPGLRERLGRRAFQTFEARHTWARRAAEVLKGLEERLGDPR